MAKKKAPKIDEVEIGTEEVDAPGTTPAATAPAGTPTATADIFFKTIPSRVDVTFVKNESEMFACVLDKYDLIYNLDDDKIYRMVQAKRDIKYNSMTVDVTGNLKDLIAATDAVIEQVK